MGTVRVSGGQASEPGVPTTHGAKGMPQGKRTTCETGRIARGPLLPAWRPALTLSVLALLAACGQSSQTPSSKHVAAVHGSYNRPSSYDPPGPAGDPWGPYIRDASRRFDVPERWIREVMRQESGGRIGATSPVGAMGLMQVMPGTYRELRSRYGFGDDPYHPYDSIMAGAAYIREMYDLYGSPAFLAAYNAGPRRLEDYLWNNRGLPNETRNYVARIGPNIVAHHPSKRAAPEIYAAAEIPLVIPAGPRRMDSATMLALREQRDAQQPGITPTVLAGTVVRMDPIPDGSTMDQPVQVASLGPVVRMDPIPDGSTSVSVGAPAGEVMRMEPIPNPPVPSGAPARAGTGAGPLPAAAAPPRRPPRARRRGAADPIAALARRRRHGPPRRCNRPGARLRPARHRPGLHPADQAIRPAVARGPALRAAAGSWAVQVGAFANPSQARGAAEAAQDAAGGRTAVQPVAPAVPRSTAPGSPGCPSRPPRPPATG